MSVLVAISDLFFASKVDAAIAATGKGATRAKRGESLVSQIALAGTKRLLIELGSSAYGAPAIELIAALKGDDATRAIQIVGYCRHTEIDRIRAAKSAGADRVLTQGELAELLPLLLDENAELPRGSASCD